VRPDILGNPGLAGRHGETPRVDASACVVATAVVRAAVRIGTDPRILFGR